MQFFVERPKRPGNRLRSFGIVTLLVASTLLLFMHAQNVEAQRTSAAEPKKVCFAQTGQCIVGDFLTYFEQNGGADAFGFPIGSQVVTHNPITGRTYLTQWFQRARFESHDEQGIPYKILLGKVGEERFSAVNANWQNLPVEAGSKSGCIWFAERKHNVCDQTPGAGFATYWKQHGLADPRISAYSRSLMRFGYPLTEAVTERTSTGETIITQWFQRARLEWRADRSGRYSVVDAPLGTELTSTKK